MYLLKKAIFFEYTFEVSNKGYHFEFLTLKALQEAGHVVHDTNLLTVSEGIISDKDQKAVNVIKDIFQGITPQVFRVANPKTDNTKSLSSDFISPELGVSCKSGNEVVKAPAIGSIYNKVTGKIIHEEILLEYKDIRNIREEFLKTINMSRQEFFKLIAIKEYELLSKLSFSSEQVQEVYYFLMGREKPLILKKNSKDITAYWLNKIPAPQSVELIFSDHQLKLQFDNGICLQKRFKTGYNSKTPGRWYNLFKEEWKVISTPVWELTKQIHSLK